MKLRGVPFLLLVLALLLGTSAFAQEGTMLRYAQSFPTDIDPAVGGDYSSTRALTILYDTLVYPDTEGMPQPHVAESWEVNSEGTVWTFFLREGIKFHDGSELTAHDVKYSMDRLLNIGEGWAFLFKDVVEEIKVINDYTVKIELQNPFGPFLSILYKFYILNKDLILDNLAVGPYGEYGDYGRDFLLVNDAGSGPYTVTEFRRGEHLLMEKFDGYWGYIAPNAPDFVKQVGTIEPVTVRTMMSRRELEISDQWQSPEAFEALARIGGVDLAQLNLGGIFVYMIHTRSAPTDCVHIRRAINYATDYDTMINNIFRGWFTQSMGAVNQNVPGHDPTVYQFSFDLEKAREEVEKSKYYGQLQDYPVEIYWNNAVPVQERIALMLQATLRQIGITANVVRVPWSTIVDHMSDIDSSPNLIPMFLSCEYPEAGAILDSRYSSGSAPTLNQNEWLLDEEFDRMIKDALSTLDQEERFAKYAYLQHYIVDLAPTLFLFDDESIHAYQSAYVDWPAARGEGIPIIGYELDARWIEVFPDRIP